MRRLYAARRAACMGHPVGVLSGSSRVLLRIVCCQTWPEEPLTPLPQSPVRVFEHAKLSLPRASPCPGASRLSAGPGPRCNWIWLVHPDSSQQSASSACCGPFRPVR